VYSEKLLVGYRYYDAHGLNFSTGFPFSHGLSYTSFVYSNVSVKGMSVSMTLENSGAVEGAEVVQLYLGYPASAGEPVRVLRGFERKELKAEEAAMVSFELTPRDVSVWDPSKHTWVLVEGEFKVFLGSSSRDLRLSTKLQIGPTTVHSS
jgi:beta-glucosidase